MLKTIYARYEDQQNRGLYAGEWEIGKTFYAGNIGSYRGRLFQVDSDVVCAEENRPCPPPVTYTTVDWVPDSDKLDGKHGVEYLQHTSAIEAGDFLVADGLNAFSRKSLIETRGILGMELNPPGMVSASVEVSVAQTLALNLKNIIAFGKVNWDTHAAWNATTSRYTVPTSGKYQIDAHVYRNGLSFAATSTTFMELCVSVNGTNVKKLSLISLKTATDTMLLQGTAVLNLAAGQYVEITLVTPATAGSAGVVPLDAAATYLDINRIGVFA